MKDSAKYVKVVEWSDLGRRTLTHHSLARWLNGGERIAGAMGKREGGSMGAAEVQSMAAGRKVSWVQNKP